MDKIIDRFSPIGVFDSGMGGLSIVNTIKDILPQEDVIYFGDNKNAPYGTKSTEVVKSLSNGAIEFLASKGVKAIVIACNTATSAAAKELRNKMNIPIIGMEPAVNLAVSSHKNNIGVFATELTLKEKKFDNLLDAISANSSVYRLPAPKLVDFVERGKFDYDEFTAIVDTILTSHKHNKLDSIVLGCTHYVFLKDFFNRYFDNSIDIFDGNEGTVKHLKNTLAKSNMLNNKRDLGKIAIYSSDTNAIEEMKKYVTAEYII